MGAGHTHCKRQCCAVTPLLQGSKQASHVELSWGIITPWQIEDFPILAYPATHGWMTWITFSVASPYGRDLLLQPSPACLVKVGSRWIICIQILRIIIFNLTPPHNTVSAACDWMGRYSRRSSNGQGCSGRNSSRCDKQRGYSVDERCFIWWASCEIYTVYTNHLLSAHNPTNKQTYYFHNLWNMRSWHCLHIA